MKKNEDWIALVIGTTNSCKLRITSANILMS